MNILQLLGVGGVGGAETLAVALAQGLIARGHRATLVNTWTDSPFNVVAQGSGIPFVALPGGRRRIGPRWFRVVRGYLKCHRFDIVHTYGNRISLSLRLMQRICRVRHHVLAVHGLDARRGRLDVLFDRCTEHLVDEIACVSRTVADKRRAVVGTPASRIRVIPNGIDLSRFHPGFEAPSRRELNLPDGFLVANVANFQPEKDHATLLEAVAVGGDALNGAKFVLIGEGPLRSRVEDDIDRLRLRDRVLLVGTRPDVRPYVKACDAFVLSSWSEGMPLAVMEAMALGLPVVTTDAGGIPEIADHERDALVVPTRCPKSLAEALVRIIRDAELRRRLGEAAAKRIREGFDIEAMIDRYVELYEEVLVRGTQSPVMMGG